MNIKENKKILILLIFLIVLFMSLIVYLSYFTIFKASEVIDNPANRRDYIDIAGIKRGSILDRRGEVVAFSDGEKYNYVRHYPYPNIYSHVIGYNSKTRGNSALESSYNKELLGLGESRTLKTIKAFFDKKVSLDKGNDLVITIDTKIQQKSRDLLDDLGEKASIVVMNPKSGEILSLVSYPDFNVETIDKDYASIVKQNNGAFYNSAIQGGYAPGSTMKLITAASIIENDIDQNYKDEGEESLGGHPIRNAGNKEYGRIDLNKAFTFSVNTYFANKAILLGNERLGQSAEKFMFNKKIDFDLNTSSSRLSVSKFNYNKWDNQALASAAIGQADVLATPLQMCMVASSIANEGKMMQPYIVSSIRGADGSEIMTREPKVLSQAVLPETAEEIKDMMINVVRRGSGKAASLRSVQVAGKSGTAQRSIDNNDYNAWFIGFAPADNPQVAVAIVVENVDSLGGEIAAPIARDIIRYSLSELNK
ncbi:MAG: peptidoglycan D,D-transpeptidase FtsI family protein [Peptoniphilaceae bacterium]